MRVILFEDNGGGLHLQLNNGEKSRVHHGLEHAKAGGFLAAAWALLNDEDDDWTTEVDHLKCGPHPDYWYWKMVAVFTHDSRGMDVLYYLDDMGLAARRYCGIPEEVE